MDTTITTLWLLMHALSPTDQAIFDAKPVAVVTTEAQCRRLQAAVEADQPDTHPFCLDNRKGLSTWLAKRLY